MGEKRNSNGVYYAGFGITRSGFGTKVPHAETLDRRIDVLYGFGGNVGRGDAEPFGERGNRKSGHTA